MKSARVARRVAPFAFAGATRRELRGRLRAPLSSLRKQGPITTGFRCDTRSELQLAQKHLPVGMGPGSRFACPGRRGETQVLVLAARNVRGVGNEPPSHNRGRREGRVPTAPMVRVQQKKHAAEPQVQADHPAFPARWLYGLYVIFPVTGLVATVACGSSRKLSACIGAPEPHDFAVRCDIIRPRNDCA